MPKTATAPRRPAPRRSALAVSLSAALLGGTVLTGVLAGTADAAPAGTQQPRPPARMSTVGGDRLGIPGTQVAAGAGVPALPATTARSWIVADAETGAVLASHNAHWQLAPASTLKMLFADTVLPKFPKTTVHKVKSSDLEGMGAGSSLVGVEAGLPYTVADLWRGVFLRSGNDAVHVLAAMNGGVPKTVVDMNAMAHELQAGDTHVVSPDGYDRPGQVSSAYDLTLFARAGLQNADFREYCSTVTAKFPGEWKKDASGRRTGPRETFEMQNTNRLLIGDYYVARYPGIAGVKNGNTTNAGATFTGVAQRGGRTLLVTVMHPAPQYDLVYHEAAHLLDWGFKAAGTAQPVGTLVPPLSKLPHPSAGAGGGTHAQDGSPADAATTTAPASSRRGLLSAAGLALSTVVVLGVLVVVIRRRRPLPAAGGGSPYRAGSRTAARGQGGSRRRQGGGRGRSRRRAR